MWILVTGCRYKLRIVESRLHQLLPFAFGAPPFPSSYLHIFSRVSDSSLCPPPSQWRRGYTILQEQWASEDTNSRGSFGVPADRMTFCCLGRSPPEAIFHFVLFFLCEMFNQPAAQSWALKKKNILYEPWKSDWSHELKSVEGLGQRSNSQIFYTVSIHCGLNACWSWMVSSWKE